MQKPAHSQYPLNDLIRDRWSPVAFSSRKIPAETLGSLFEAARWAASSYNEQPWCFFVATRDQPAEFDALLSCLMKANQAWGQHAYALVLSCARLEYARNGKPNRHAYHDVGLATQNLVLQALSHGLYCHAMGGFDVQKARETLKIPETYEPVAAIAIGYPAEDLSAFPDDLQQRQLGARVRKPLEEMVFRGTWGEFAGPFA